MQTVLITGAGGHLGTTVTRYFLNKGYKVIAAVHHEHGGGTPNPQLVAASVDLTSEEAAASFVTQMIASHGPIHAALLLAGGFAAGDIQHTSIGDVRAQMQLNFDTAYNVVRPLFTDMLSRGTGRIVLIGSKPALQPALAKHMIAYALSKAMLVQLAEMLNQAAKGTNVTVSVVAPSTIDTEINRKSMPDASFEDWVKPEKLAEILEFVCSDAASVLRETVLKAYHNA